MLESKKKDNCLRGELKGVFFPFIDMLDSGVLLIDSSYYVRFFNKEFLNLYSISYETIFNQNIKSFLGIEVFRKIIIACGKITLEGSKKQEIEIKRSDAINVFFTIVIIKTKGQSGKEYFILNFRDVTKKRELENKLLEAQKEIENVNKLKFTFLSQMSHEIRTPINTILNYVTLLKDESKCSGNQSIIQSFNTIDRAGYRIVRTIEEILNYSEIQANLYQCVFERIDIKSVILSIINDFSEEIKENNLDLQFKCNTFDTQVTIDRYSVRKIFIHLIENAIKYSAEGRILISVDRGEGASLVIKVTDTGIGISENYLSEIFTPFTQEDQGYTRLYDGNGLGLCLVKKYCDLNEVKIEVESEKGIGSTFVLLFNTK